MIIIMRLYLNLNKQMDTNFTGALTTQLNKYKNLDAFMEKMHSTGLSYSLFQLYTQIIHTTSQLSQPKEALAQILKDNIALISSEICI